jgi:uncharacterized membrane protein YphA (DoxX/SURF4 family)
MLKLLNGLQNLMDAVVRGVDFLGPLALRVFLAPIFILSGYNKLSHIEDLAPWFASLGLPAPEVMVWLAALAEFFGGIALLVGLAVRWFAVPLMVTMVTMVVAATSVHWDNGWHALPETQLTMPWEWRTDLIEEANVRKDRAEDILREHSNYGWITSAGSITILKNGIEFAATYFVMLLALFFLGAGRFFSLDYWIARRFRE